MNARKAGRLKRRQNAGKSAFRRPLASKLWPLTSENEWGGRGSNPRPTDYESLFDEPTDQAKGFTDRS